MDLFKLHRIEGASLKVLILPQFTSICLRLTSRVRLSHLRSEEAHTVICAARGAEGMAACGEVDAHLPRGGGKQKMAEDGNGSLRRSMAIRLRQSRGTDLHARLGHRQSKGGTANE